MSIEIVNNLFQKLDALRGKAKQQGDEMSKRAKQSTKRTNELMGSLAASVGMTYDGGAGRNDAEDDRLFFDDEMICVYCHLMTAADFKRMEKEINKLHILGKGYEVYAWDDCSGFQYWKNQGKKGDHNYIQITARITHPAKVDPKQLKRDVDHAYGMLCHWDNRDEYFDWELSRRERKRLVKP